MCRLSRTRCSLETVSKINYHDYDLEHQTQFRLNTTENFSAAQNARTFEGKIQLLV